MPFAARLTGLHACPISTVPVPDVSCFVGGRCVPTILIGFLLAAVVGDALICAGPPDVIVSGSTTVLIGGRPAARVGDTTAHGGKIVAGCPTVIIG
jgi:uncharacterized Zn-binding protein involved in type VI secretion